MEQNYVNIMIDSLKKKIDVLDAIIKENEKQADILSKDETDWESFDKSTDDKAELIDQMDDLDQGFDNLFERVRNDLDSPAGRQKYREQISVMQQLIRQITEKSVSIQSAESRNKRLVEKRFAESHQRIGKTRTSSRIARDYYKNMQQTHVIAPAFLDSKK